MKLSKRMEMILSLASNIVCPTWSQLDFAESGCDHAYLSIELLRRGIAGRVCAMDIVDGPLKAARENIEAEFAQSEWYEKIQTRKSDGLQNLKAGEAEALLVAGMGGGTLLHILRQDKELVSSMKCLVLQPQSELFEVRSYLYEQGFWIAAEDMCEEDGKYYSALVAVSGQDNPEQMFINNGTLIEKGPFSREQLMYGPINLREKNQVLYRFLKKQRDKMIPIYEGLKKSKKPQAKEDEERIHKLLKQLENALQFY